MQTALDLGVPVTGIAEAVFARALSGPRRPAAAAARALPGPDAAARRSTDRDGFVEDVRQALYASKIVAYAQGFDQIAAGSEEYGWDIDLGAMATIWRGGCIIRARFLDRITEAYDAEPDLTTLLSPTSTSPTRSGRRRRTWRRVVAARGADRHARRPAFSPSLSYYDGLRRERLPAALIQGLRDFFGAHTYQRVDRDGTFHTDWAGTAAPSPRQAEEPADEAGGSGGLGPDAPGRRIESGA